MKTPLCFLLTVILVLFGSYPSLAKAQYLIFHLDAVSSRDFFAELEQGNLPNIERIFSLGIQVPYGLTLFPGGTEVIYPRMKTGEANNTNPLVGWSYYDRENHTIVKDVEVFFALFSSLPRRARMSFVYGAPVFDRIGALSLLNAKQILNRYGVFEFIWFATDFQGHLVGEEGHKKSLYQFDRALGYLPLNELEDVNFILYTDHGMSLYDLVTVDLEEIVQRVGGDSVFYYAYPNLYLKDDMDKVPLAKALVQEGIDFVFLKEEEVVYGYHKEGMVLFREKEDAIQYSFYGVCPFGYEEIASRGDYLTKEEWLTQTKTLDFPAVPPNLTNYLTNPYVGDLVLVLNAPQIPLTIRANEGNHAGILHSDLLVPILASGPNVGHLEGRTCLYLHELYSVHFPDIPFGRNPPREYHRVRINPGKESLGLVLSPSYRVKSDLLLKPCSLSFTLSYDVFATYLSRVFLGVGVTLEEELQGHLRATYELTLGNLQSTTSLTLKKNTPLEWQHTLSVFLHPNLSLDYTQKTLGLTLYW